MPVAEKTVRRASNNSCPFDVVTRCIVAIVPLCPILLFSPINADSRSLGTYLLCLLATLPRGCISVAKERLSLCIPMACVLQSACSACCAAHIGGRMQASGG